MKSHARSQQARKLGIRIQRGFTLVELMIAMLLGLLIIGGVIAVFLSNKQTYATHNAISQVQDGTRIAFELLSKDIRETGLTGCGNSGRIANVLNNGPNGAGTQRWYANIANAIRGYDANTTDPAVATATSPANERLRVASTSSIQLVGADGVGVSVTSHNTTTAKITLNETTTAWTAGDLYIACDPDHAVIAQATSITAGPPIVLTSATGTGVGDPGNCSTGLGFPTSCASAAGNIYEFVTNSQVAKLRAVDWYIGYNPLGGMSLYRMTLTNIGGVPTATAQEMVRDVTDMRIRYHSQGGTSFTTAALVADWNLVDAVMLTLTIQSSVRFAGTNNATPLFRNIPITVTLRNRIQ